jgi:hypothetical protein
MVLFGLSTIQAQELTVSNIELPEAGWGDHSIKVEINNSGAGYKFIVAHAEVSFVEGILSPSRHYWQVIFSEPESNVKADIPVFVPTSYGKAQISLKMYDVIDTLDVLLESQKFFEKDVTHNFLIPPQIQHKIDIGLPVLARQNELIDNAFTRVLMVLLGEGKSIEEIANMCETKQEFVESIVAALHQEKYLYLVEGRYKPNFMVISKDMVDDIQPAANETVDQLYEAIINNLPEYDKIVSEMVVNGQLTNDINDALDPGVVLHHKYPFIMTFLLWNLLGRDFISGGMPFNILEDSDPCNSNMGDFFYLVAGGEKSTGQSFYYHNKTRKGDAIYCGYGYFEIRCPRNYKELKGQNKYVRWTFSRESNEIAFLFNSETLVTPAKSLLPGTAEPVNALLGILEESFAGAAFDKYQRGAKYWCWNIVVTRLLDKLVENGILEKEGSGLYNFQKAN